MATPNGYGSNIRQSLINKGVNNKDIGFNKTSGSVTVKGKDFMKPSKMANGVSFDTQAGFNKAWNSFSPSISTAVTKAANNFKTGNTTPGSNNPKITQTATNMANTFSVPKPPQTRLETTLGNLSSAVNKPFQYNPENDQAYQAYVQQALSNLNTTQANTNARLRAGGQGKSSYSETLANQLGNQAAQEMQNTMIQQYLPMAYQQHQDQISNLGNLYNTEYQQDVTRPLSIAQQTGTYQDPELMNLYNTVLQAKQSYSAAQTPAERKAANQAAEMARQQIRMMGGNPDLVSAKVTYDQALGNQGNFGIRTLAGQAQDLAAKQTNLDAAMAVGDRSGRMVAPQSDWTGLYRQAANPDTPMNWNAQQDVFNNNMQNRQQNFNEGQQAWQNEFQNRQQNFNEGQQGWENQFNLRQQDFNEAQQAWKNTFDEKQFEEDTRRFGLNYAIDLQAQNLRKKQFDYEKELNADAKKDMETEYKGQIADMILSQNLPDDQTEELFKKYGINDKVLQQLLSGN